MITQNELALKILNMGKDGYKNDAEGFEKLNKANTLIEVYVENKLRLNNDIEEMDWFLKQKFEKDLFKLINDYCKQGLKKPDLIKKMEWVLGNCKYS